MFQRILDLFKTSPDSLQSLSALLEFLRFISVSEDIGSALPKRSFVLSNQDLSTAVAWDDKKEHLIRQLEKLLLEAMQEDNEEIYNGVLQNLRNFISVLEKSNEVADDNADSLVEPSLPESLNLISQFNKRVVHIGEVNETKLTSAYWFSSSSCDEEQENDQATCDLSEIVRTLLPSDTNIVADIKKLLLLSNNSIDGNARDEDGTESVGTTNNSTGNRPMFRTMKMDVNKENNRMPFVAPMRGRCGYMARGLHVAGGGHHGMHAGSPGGVTSGHHTVLDAFRSRPPNTSRPPSLHVDDFQALETRGAQPTGPTGYNRIPRDLLGARQTQHLPPYRHSRGRVTSWPSPHHGSAVTINDYHHDPAYSAEHFGSPNSASSGSVVVGRQHRGAHARAVGQQRSFLR